MGVQVYSQLSHFRFGLEGLQAWGVQSDAYREPLLVSGWGQFLPEDGLQVYLRIDGHHEFELKQQQVYYAGVGYRPEGDLRIWLGIEHNVNPLEAGQYPGAEALSAQQQIFIQVDGQFRHKQFVPTQ